MEKQTKIKNRVSTLRALKDSLQYLTDNEADITHGLIIESLISFNWNFDTKPLRPLTMGYTEGVGAYVSFFVGPHFCKIQYYCEGAEASIDEKPI